MNASLRVAAAAGLLLLGPRVESRAEPAVQCGLEQSAGVSQADADTAARLICEELKRRGAGAGRFGVSVSSLGTSVIVTTTREDTRDSITVQTTFEEIPVAARRIAEALVARSAFVSTQRVDNLLAAETREALTKKGSVKFALGVLNALSPGHGASSPGFAIGLVYSSPRFSLPAEMRFAWNDWRGGPEPRMSLFSISVGGRAYLSKHNLSPFAGGGFGALRLSASEGEYPYAGPRPTIARTDYFDATRWSVSPYAEVGVEFLRLHRGRVALHLRADLPLSALRSEEIVVYDWEARTSPPRVDRVIPARSRYVLPLAACVSVAF